MAANGWTLLGPTRARPRGSMLGIALALLIAPPNFERVPNRYPGYLVVFAIAGAAWFTYLAIRERALVGLLLLPVSLVWLNPFFGADWFVQQGWPFFVPHAVLSLLFATAAYTYAGRARE